MPLLHYRVVLQSLLLSVLRVPNVTVLRVSSLHIQQVADFQTVMLVSPVAKQENAVSI
jgi:hypothetical protein